MKLAFLIQCHKNPQQINTLIETLSHPDIDFYIHIDKKSRLEFEINTKDNVLILPEESRMNVKWGTFSQVQATLNLLEYAHQKKIYDYYWLISGQDFPLVSAETIIEMLRTNPNHNYVNLVTSKNNGAKYSTNYDKRNDILFPAWLLKHDFKHRIFRRIWVSVTGGYHHTFWIFKRKDNNNIKYYFGSSWWCINAKFTEYILKFIDTHQEYVNFYRKTSCPDESFFQTLLMNSEFADSRKDYLHYIDWSEGKSSPKTLTCKDLDAMFNSHKFMARKIDSEVDANIITEIKKKN